jgi:septal ring factor EnvC (AmiA/AmiB activator)
MFEGTKNIIEQHEEAINKLNNEITHLQSVISQKEKEIKYFEAVLNDLKKLR